MSWSAPLRRTRLRLELAGRRSLTLVQLLEARERAVLLNGGAVRGKRRRVDLVNACDEGRVLGKFLGPVEHARVHEPQLSWHEHVVLHTLVVELAALAVQHIVHGAASVVVRGERSDRSIHVRVRGVPVVGLALAVLRGRQVVDFCVVAEGARVLVDIARANQYRGRVAGARVDTIDTIPSHTAGAERVERGHARVRDDHR
mmetsp:Transcript_6615/g.16797  ORF Transcript_6615/g.16797 Transcript_6615/m.16797 type:complete len:201 (-) Transcript_6615:470-1072(-)